MTTKVDLSKLAENSNLKVSIQSIQPEDPVEAKIRRIKDIVLFAVGLLFVLLIAAVCVYFIFSSSSTSDDKRWSMGVLSSLVTAFLGFITGRSLSV